MSTRSAKKTGAGEWLGCLVFGFGPWLGLSLLLINALEWGSGGVKSLLRAPKAFGLLQSCGIITDRVARGLGCILPLVSLTRNSSLPSRVSFVEWRAPCFVLASQV